MRNFLALFHASWKGVIRETFKRTYQKRKRTWKKRIENVSKVDDIFAVAEQARSPMQAHRVQSRIVSPRDDNEDEEDEDDEAGEEEDEAVAVTVSPSASKEGKSKRGGASRANKRQTTKGSLPSASKASSKKPVLLREEKKPARYDGF